MSTTEAKKKQNAAGTSEKNSATPTVVRVHLEPRRKVIADLSHEGVLRSAPGIRD